VLQDTGIGLVAAEGPTVQTALCGQSRLVEVGEFFAGK
jgi:hypothetical protein